MSFAHLSEAQLDAVQAAAIALGFNSDANLDALASGIRPAFIGAVTTGGNANARLVTATNAMNSTRNLTGGEVPFTKWLRNAILLAGGRPEEQVFRDALAAISVDAVAPAGPADVVQAPVSAPGELEVLIDEDDTLAALFLHLGVEASRSIAKLHVHRHFAGVASMKPGNEPDVSLGTGWMIAPDLMITNHHVIAARTKDEPPPSAADFEAQALSTRVQFDYLAIGDPGTVTTAIGCEAEDANLDFAVLRLAAGAGRPPLRLLASPLVKPPASALRARVNVLQYPDGNPMRLGFRNNFVVTGEAGRLSYLTDTAGGSSGSPVCDDAWFVAALHRGWRTIENGPVRVWGKPISQENYGTPIGLILDHLATAHPGLRAEIAAGQGG
jgi:V8-like Glu-specific endopeptidase